MVAILQASGQCQGGVRTYLIVSDLMILTTCVRFALMKNINNQPPEAAFTRADEVQQHYSMAEVLRNFSGNVGPVWWCGEGTDGNSTSARQGAGRGCDFRPHGGGLLCASRRSDCSARLRCHPLEWQYIGILARSCFATNDQRRHTRSPWVAWKNRCYWLLTWWSLGALLRYTTT